MSLTSFQGLFPRVREIPIRWTAGIPIQRTIPAHAGDPAHDRDYPPLHRSIPVHTGNPLRVSVRLLFCTAYPRPHGEPPSSSKRLSYLPGLPPPTRGTRRCFGVHCANERPTPAHAGNPSQRNTTDLSHSVYPRPRGESYHRASSFFSRIGLPPPMRGIQIAADAQRLCERSTPTHAGNPGQRQPAICR